MLALAVFISAVQTVDARQRGFGQDRGGREPAAKPVEEKKPVGPLFAVVSLADQHVSFYDANGLWARSVVSTGVNGHPTPTGIFTILEKERWHNSNIYSGAPMPFMQRMTWTGVAMHEGVVTGRPASHGCVRLPSAFAKRLFSVTSEGQRVIISSQEVKPFDIRHAHLPAPRLSTPSAPLDGARNAASKAVETVALDGSVAAAKAGPDAKPLNPQDYAKVLKSATAAKAASLAPEKKAAIADLDTKSMAARKADKEVDAAEVHLRVEKENLQNATRAEAKAQGDDAVKRAAEKKSVVERDLAAAETRLREARDAKAAWEQDVLSARNTVREIDAKIEATAAELKDASVRLAPVSIFISRKTGRLYVRQATQHIFDVPVTIRNPERPLGSHLFIATRMGDDGASLRWSAMTPPAAVEVKIRRHSSRRGRKIEPERETPITPAFPETAAAALDRIEMPPEAAERIAERLWIGSTMIISDVGMSGEGRYAMDFMILGRTPIREE
jgi:hypothetical protein